MRYAVVPASQLAAAESWGVQYHVLMTWHRPLVDELLATFTTEELYELADVLPFDEQAANAVVPRTHRVGRFDLMELLGPKKLTKKDRQFDEDGWWGKPPKARPPLPRERRLRRLKLAVYCAAAAQDAKAKIAEELLEITQQKLAVAKRLHAVHTMAKTRGAATLAAALVKGGPPDAPDPKATPTPRPAKGRKKSPKT